MGHLTGLALGPSSEAATCLPNSEFCTSLISLFPSSSFLSCLRSVTSSGADLRWSEMLLQAQHRQGTLWGWGHLCGRPYAPLQGQTDLLPPSKQRCPLRGSYRKWRINGAFVFLSLVEKQPFFFFLLSFIFRQNYDRVFTLISNFQLVVPLLTGHTLIRC